MNEVYLNAMGVDCALGQGAQAVRERLFAAPGVFASPLTLTDRYSPGRPLHLGLLPQEPAPLGDDVPVGLRSRNNALLRATLAQLRAPVEAAIARYGSHRIAVVVGISSPGVVEGEVAGQCLVQGKGWPTGYHLTQQEMGSACAFVARELALCGPSYAISTACSSGAKAFASAARLLRAGLADAVIAGGVDALCRLTVAGFSALDSVSAAPCNPLSRNRCGINIGEGAGLFLLSREPGPVRLAGWGESSDAHHMSAPDPGGRGALDAMRQAVQRAGVAPQAIDYVNLHGTATPLNDAMESLAVAALCGPDVAVSSTKPLTGHTLAAAGAVEAAIAWLTLVDNPQGRLPPHCWDGQRDPALAPLRVARIGETLGRAPHYVLSNSFAFGGSNASLLLAAG